METWYYTRIAVRILSSQLIILHIFPFSTFTEYFGALIRSSTPSLPSHSFAGSNTFFISSHPIASFRAIVER
jgi:hypothetical protein